jgi:hypothetical protein
VAAGLVAVSADWVYSSYREFVGLCQGTLPSPDIILSQFLSVQAYGEFGLVFWIWRFGTNRVRWTKTAEQRGVFGVRFALLVSAGVV